jgi:predicted Zn-dependent peptidase
MRRSVNRLVPILACLILALASSAGSFDFSALEKTVTEYTLDNGLKILVMERHDAPVVAFATLVDVGEVDSPKGYGGLPHMFEHLAFKGTTTLGTKDYKKEAALMRVEDSIFMELRAERAKGPLADSTRIAALIEAGAKAVDAAFQMVVANEYSSAVEREGGVWVNAGTADDWTVYVMSLPSNKLELWMAMESERFLNPVFREMYKERDVIAEERRQSRESSPIGRVYEEFTTLAFKAHPYGQPSIGAMSDIQNYTRQAATAFFKEHYVPTNMVVVIVGDVNPAEVYRLANKYFGRLARKPAPGRIITVEPEQLGERRMVMEDPSQPVYMAGWHIPEATHADVPALNALADYLGKGRTSVLYKNLIKDKKIAINVTSFTGVPGSKYPNLFAVWTWPSTGHTNEECEAEIFREVEKVQNEPIPAEELDKIKARSKAEFINQLEDAQGFSGLPVQLALYQTMWGDWHQMFRELDRINAVTVEDIQRVAKQYLTKKNRVVVMLNTVKS